MRRRLRGSIPDQLEWEDFSSLLRENVKSIPDSIITDSH